MVLILTASAILKIFLRKYFTAKRRRHRRYRAKASSVLDQLASIRGFPARMAYLRKIDPYVFEEAILEALERQGYRIVRNKAYSGDDGIDGKVFIEGRLHLIQAKRYSSAINPVHVRAFDAVTRRHRAHGGLFVHTGRTGKSVRGIEAVFSGRIRIVSGEALLELLVPGAISDGKATITAVGP